MAITLFSVIFAVLLFLENARAKPTRQVPRDDAPSTVPDDVPFPITGVPVGGVQPRLEVRTMSQQNDLWSLFLLAMDRFLQGSQDEMLSFYQVAAIHYLPTQPWNNVAGLVDWGGYCGHNSNLFGLWHRPYVALVEQIMHMHATDIVNEMNPDWQQAQYRDALLRLRFPYWDWATKSVNGQIVPSVIETPTVTVFLLNGTAKQISNPLYAYEFQPGPPSFYGAVDPSYGPALPYSDMYYTVRQAQTNSSNATTDNIALELQFQSLYSSINSRLNAIFTINQTFNQFSNWGDGSGTPNLEHIHDDIHVSFGQFSYMAPLSMAAFDPIFFLHHCNVDRLIAMLQVTWPDTYVEPAKQPPWNTYTIWNNSIQDADSDLKPFYMTSDGAFWTANAARDVNIFNYTYNELLNYTDSVSMQKEAQKLYPATTGSTAPSTAMTAMTDSVDIAQVFTETYFTQVNMSLSAIGGSYSVDFFVGDVPSDPSSWRISPGYVGSATAPYMPMPPGMANTRTGISKNMVMLTQALQDAYQSGQLKGMDEESVLAFLQGNLHWRVVKNDIEVPVDDVPDLSVIVASTKVRPATADAGARWVGPIVQHPEVTNT